MNSFKLFADADRLIAHSHNFLERIKTHEVTSKENYKSIPLNATIRSEDIKCGKPFCFHCPHGTYYYAYWKDVNGKLKKKYIGTKFEPSWRPKTKGNRKTVSSSEEQRVTPMKPNTEYLEKLSYRTLGVNFDENH